MSESAQRAKSIFLNAVERVRPDQWAGFLESACGGDTELRARVEELLKAHADLGTFRDQDKGYQPTEVYSLPSEKPGTLIGNYKVLQEIGQGGFGVVYMAEQQQPVQRKVALKIIKPGMDTREVIARFEAERQALAMMDHPNIARVLDAGATESGRPYFVMELVRGIPITEYCDQGNLTTRQRMELFITVCQAVQHAHQKGIIHRDIKPSNVMITLHDGRPVVKVIDFGIAKAINQKLTEKTLFTNYAQMIGTPLYMSPEQAELSGLDVDTRTDIYSLGVLLYELLSGDTPFDKQRLREAAYDEIRRIIREEDPPKPSTKVSTMLGESATDIAAHRGSDPKKLSSTIRGDLDWIVMKAMEKDRSRRYETANGFAADIERFLNDEPVTACPPSVRYRLRKFVRRNKTAVSSIALIAGALLLGIVGTTFQSFAASAAAARAQAAEALAQQRYEAERQARSDAEQAQEKENIQRVAAQREATRARMIADVIFDMINSASPYSESAHSQEYTLRQFMLDASHRLDTQLDSQPEVKAELLGMLANWQMSMQLWDDANNNLSNSSRILRDLYGERHPTIAENLLYRAEFWNFAQSDRKKAAELANQALEMSRTFPEETELILRCYDKSVHFAWPEDEADRIAAEGIAFARQTGSRKA